MKGNRTVKPWIEILFREDNVPWNGFGDLSPDHYRLIGGPLPLSEFEYICDVFQLFQTIPEGLGLEDWFHRPMRSMDMLLLCRRSEVSPRSLCTPVLVASDADFVRHGMLEGMPEDARLCRMTRCVDHFTITLRKARGWASRLKQTFI